MTDFYDTSAEVGRLKARYPAPPSKEQAAAQISDKGGLSDIYSLSRAVEERALMDQGAPGATSPSQFPMVEAGSRGAIQGLGAAGGLVAGLKVGAPAMGIPYVGPVITAGTGIAGMVMGAGAADKFAEGTLGLRSPEQMPADQRPRAIFGQNVGAGLSMIMPVYGAASMGARFADDVVGGFFKSIVDTARNSPKLFGAVEVTSSISAGLGGAAAESADPGNAKLRFGMEVVSGFANPVWRANQLYHFVSNSARSTVAKFGGTAQQDVVARQMLTLMAEEGTDPVAVIRVLKQQMPKEFDVALTAGQKSGDDIVIGFERALYEHNGKFSNDAKIKAQAAMDLMRVQMGLLAQSGKPGALADIARLRQARFETLIADRLEAGGTEAAMSIARISKGGTQADMASLSTDAMVILMKVEADASNVSNNYWSRVDKTKDVPSDNFVRAHDEILAESAKHLKSEKIPDYISKTINDLKSKQTIESDYDPVTFVITEKPSKPPSVKSFEMIDLRGKLNEASRIASKGGEDRLARYLFKLESAIYDDLDVVFGKLGDTSYDNARGFTKAYHDVFDRTFVGGMALIDGAGNRIPPALALTRAMAGKGIAADIRLRDLERASGLVESRGIGEPGVIQTMLDTQEKAYRIVTSASLNKDGRVNPVSVRKYIDDNAVLFNREPFTEIKKDLLTAIKSEDGLRRLENLAKARNRDIGKDSAFAQITRTDPIEYASKVLVSTRDQENKLISMFNLAKKGSGGISVNEGVSSARASLFGAAIERNMRGTVLDLDGFRASLLQPSVPGGKPAIQVMQEQGVVDAKHVQNIRAYFDILDNVSKASRLGGTIPVEAGAGEVGVLLGAKILASKGTTVVTKAVGADKNGLIIPAAVAKATEQFVSKIPQAKTKDMGVLLFNDPEMLALALERNIRNTPTDQARKLRQLNAWFMYSGLITPSDYIDREYERPAKPADSIMMTLPP
jgi:hypothetical protein